MSNLYSLSDHPPASRRARGLTYLIRGVGLVGVAVVAGLVWTLIQSRPGTQAAVTGTSHGDAGHYAFTRVGGPVTDGDCVAHAFGGAQEFFRHHPCQRLTRALYSTTLPNGLQAVSSVAVVEMASGELATRLHDLIATEGTGNVNDLLKDGARIAIGGLSSQQLQQGGYASEVGGNATTIALSVFVGGHQDDALLKQISGEALQVRAG
ncbi:MAG: hypothetical protein JOZ47_10120 [Kutzneria sp.]|nr:hypothetical protein [Kutzneria sp.]